MKTALTATLAVLTLASGLIASPAGAAPVTAALTCDVTAGGGPVSPFVSTSVGEVYGLDIADAVATCVDKAQGAGYSVRVVIAVQSAGTGWTTMPACTGDSGWQSAVAGVGSSRPITVTCSYGGAFAGQNHRVKATVSTSTGVSRTSYSASWPVG